MTWFPKGFIKPVSEKGKTLEEKVDTVQRPIIALSNIPILELARASPKHQQVLDNLLRKIKVKPRHHA